MHHYIHLVRFLPCRRSGAQCSLGSYRGVPPSAACMHWWASLCNRTFLDRLVSQVRGALDCANQWSTGLGFDGLLQKACLVVGLSTPMDKPIAKCGNCDRESS